MSKILIGITLLLWAVIGLLILARPAAANEPIFTAITAANEPAVAPTCYAWGRSWRTDKAELRTMIRKSFALAQNNPATQVWGLCLLMNVDYYINTVLMGCDSGLPFVRVAYPALVALGDRCAE